MERLTGQAWLATESLPLKDLKHQDGVERLSHLWQELEPLEFLRVFSTLAEFYKNFRREKGQEFVAYDMAFRAQLQRLDEIGGGIDGVTKAYWFLEKAGLSAELRKQVVAAAGGVYDYVKLRSALVAIVPQVHRAEEERSSAAPQVRQWKRGGPTSHPRQVHATLDDGELEEEAQFEDAGEDQGSEDADKLEAELEVLMTQAARKRAQVEKARGFTKNEAPEEREKRIRDMKSRMPCSACKAHGKTVYGHWHSDDACPYKSKGKASGSGKPVLAVVEEDLSDSEEDDFGPGESPIFVTVMEENWCASVGQGKNLYPREHRPIALSDTCCARTVVGEKWMQDHIKYLHNQGEDVFIVDEKRPFRFGGGPRVYSTYAVIFPLQVSGSMKVAFVRASVVQQEVPLLMSKNALKNLGATLDLAAGSLQLTALDASVRLVETASGLCGFEINQNPSERNLEVPPSELLADGCEVMICPDRDRQVHAVRQDRRERDRECEALAEQYLAEKRFRYRDLLHIVRKLPLKERRDHRDIDGRKDEPVTSFLGGLWVHGGFHGIAKTAKRYPAVIQYINAFMQKKHPGGWTSFVLMKNISTKIHKDVNNEVNTMSTTVSFGRFRGGRLWVSLSDGEKPPGGRDIVYMQDDEGNPQRGYGVCTQKTPYTFDPRCAHATCPWEGERWCLTMYTSRGIQHASQEQTAELHRLGFSWPGLSSRTFGVESTSHQEPQQLREEEVERDQYFTNMCTPQQQESHSELEASKKSCASDVNACSKEEGRVCEGHRSSMHGEGGGPQAAHGREIERDMGCSQADLSKEDAPSERVETLRSGGPQGAVLLCGGSVAAEGTQWSLGKVEPRTSHHADGDVDGRMHGESGRDSGGDASTSDTAMQAVHVADDREDKSSERRGVLWMSTFSNVPRDVATTLQWAADRLRSGKHARGREEGQQGGGEGASKGEGPVQSEGESQGTQGGGSSAELKLTRVMGASRPHPRRRGVIRGRISETRGREEGQCELDAAGDPDDREDACGEGGSDLGEQGVSHAAQGGVCADQTSDTPKELLSSDEVSRRVREGFDRRKRLKKGVGRRILGNIRSALASVWIATAATIGAAACQVPTGCQMRPDVMEIFAGQARVSHSFARWGWSTAEPVDINLGSDLRQAEVREQVLEWVDRLKPRLVILSYPCSLWSVLQNMSCHTPQERRRLQQKRKKEMCLLEFVEQVFQKQISRGDDALTENPLLSASFRTPPIQRVLTHPEVYTAVSHGCRLGVVNYKTYEPLHKPTLWISSSQEICDELGVRCQNEEHVHHHKHGECLGDREVTRHAGVYTHKIAEAICKGYVRLIRRKDPGRIRKLLRSLAARIRKHVRQRGGRPEELRWSERTVMRELKKWHAVHAVGAGSATDQPMPATLEDHGEHASVPEQSQEPIRTGLSSDGISFDVPAGRKLDESVKQGLRKAHCNLGHPSRDDLARFLKLGGAKQEVIEAVGWLRCIACAHSNKPKAHRNASIPPSQVVFGDEIQVDCICVHDASKQSHWFLSVIDRATSFHMLEIMRDHSPEELYRALDRAWCKWAGPPTQVTVDMEGGFQGREFWQRVSDGGTVLLSIAGTAHWQAGKIERHNQIVKDMLMATIRQTQTKGREAMRKLSREVAHAKNCLVREHGWSPVALVFGREPRVFGEMYEQGGPKAYHPEVGNPSSDVAERMRYRYHARLEFIRAQARQMLMQTAHQRTRRITNPSIGQLVFFWRAERSNKRDSQSRWVGPGYIVGLQGNNAWVSCGGRCFLVAGEHLREAIGDEKQYGDPEVQKALALFKKVPKEATYEDLLGQADPEPMGDLEDQPIGRDLTEDVEMDISDQAGLPEEYRSMVGYVGWYHDRFMNPVLVSHKTWALRTPEQKYSPESFPYRSTWVRIGGEWKRIEHEVKWSELEDPNAIISGGPASLMVTVFQSRTRRERCLEDVPVALKKPRIESSGSQVHAVMTKGALGKNKLKRMLEKEVPYEKIPEHEKELYRAAEEKEWKSWCDFNSCEILSPEESARVEREKGDRILPSRYVYRNKHAGLLDDQGRPLPVKAKARLCLQGHLCPDSRSGEIQVDSPTIERVSTMIFLHQVISQGWMSDWFIGDISNAFLQGAPLQGKEMFMRQPRQGLKGMLPGQLLKLLKPVYGRPDAPRAWYNELARVLEEELHLQKCVTDQCLFTLRDDQNRVRGLLVIHVDDLMLCHDGSQLGKDTVQKLKARFPFGTWDRVMDQKNGVTYCGKEIRILNDEKGEQVIALSQNGFIDGRVQKLEISRERRAESEQRATEEERSEYRSVVGSLQWLITQTRPDLAFEVNQLQKRIADLRVHDLVRANRAVQEATQHRLEIIFRNLGPDAELVVYHDAGLYSSVGVELDEREADDVLQTGMEKKLIYSQKGAVVGFVQKGATQKKNERVHLNMIDWKSATNRRVVESSFAAETHAALMGHGMARFAQVLVSEVRHGKEIVSALGDEDWQGVVSTTLCIKTVNI